MSILKRLLGKSAPAASRPGPPVRESPPPVTRPPRPDPSVRTREEDQALAAALASGNMAEVGRWVLEGSSTRIRQRAAEAIVDPEQLRDLVRATRHGKDKNVHRILTGKRDALLADERRVQQQRVEIESAAAALARHSERAVDAAYSPALELLEARWRALASQATPELQQEVDGHLERAHAALEQHRRSIEAEAGRLRAAGLAADEARRQRELEAQAAADAAAEQARIAEAARDAERARRMEDDAAVRNLVGLLHQAQAALNQGGTARATRLRAVIAEKLPQAPSLPAWFHGKLQQVDARLEELKDWKTFTVVPKRAELLARMQGLVGAEMSPEELAQHVRRLREEWRTLHRGAGNDDSPEWKQFEEAAEQAYEPCRAHFARQAERRRDNQARREALIEKLTSFASDQEGDAPNWRAIQQALVESRREWREYAPVDQAVVKDLQARFHAVVDALQARLDAEHGRNVEAKRAVIARAAALTEVEDTAQAIELAKELQREWKAIGPVPRQQDGALWEEFRKHCDAVFQRSALAAAAHDAALAAVEARAIALCEELERIGGLDGAELLAAAPVLDALHAEFAELELPRASARDLRQRISRAGEHCDAAVRRERAAAARRGWSDALSAGEQLRAYALAVAQGRSPDERETLRASAASAVAALEHAPKQARELLDHRLARLAAGECVETDLAANEEALRLLCIRAELVAGVPSPPEDQERRREYQMQRLVAAMGRGERAQPGDLDELAMAWLAAGPVDAAVAGRMLARFERCRAIASA